MANKKNRPCLKCGKLIWDVSLKKSLGLCKRCCSLGRKHSESTKEKMRKFKKAKVGYFAIHYRIYKLFGQPDGCEECKANDGNRKYEWANISGLYVLDRKDWLRLCQSCHRKMDAANPAGVFRS